MKTAYNATCLKEYQTVVIGRQMENNYRQFVFNCAGFGDVAEITLVHQRSQDVAPYIVTSETGNTLTWTVTDTDTAFSGNGQAELRITFADGLAKSVIFRTLVLKSITADTVIPEPLQSWYDAMIAYINEHSITDDQLAQAIADYFEEHPIEAPVTSVNGQQGAVVLTAADVGAIADTVTIPTKTSQLQNDSGFLSSAVTSFNGQTGAVTYTAPVSSVDGKTGAVTILPTGGTTGQVLTKTATGTAWQTVSGGGAVDSVNGQTGTVVLDASDVGALPDTTTAADLGAYVKPSGGIPKSDLASAVQTSLGKADTALQTAPVTSVNGQTGAVVIPVGGLTQAQIDALDGMFQAAAYAEDATAEYAAFCAAFGITQTYTITNTLTHVTNSNAATSITGGSAYTGTLTADTGYTIDSVTIMMGNTDITSTAYNAGSISIASVTGNISITATATSGGGKSDMNGWTDGVAYTDLTIVQNEYVNKNNGNFDPYTGWNRTGYVPIDGASTLTISKMSGAGGGSGYNAFYTQNHTFISSFEMVHTGPATVTVPSNAYYFVLSETAAQLNQVLTDGVVPNA